MANRKYYMDELKMFLVKAYKEDEKFVLDMITLVPKYRGGYRRNKYTKSFETKEYANNYFKRIRDKESLKEVSFPGMANGHVEY